MPISPKKLRAFANKSKKGGGKPHAAPSLKPPKGWFDRMVDEVDKKGVDDPAAVVGKIWSDLPDAKKAEIRGREGKSYGPAK